MLKRVAKTKKRSIAINKVPVEPNRFTKKYMKSIYGIHANKVPNKTNKVCDATFAAPLHLPINK